MRTSLSELPKPAFTTGMIHGVALCHPIQPVCELLCSWAMNVVGALCVDASSAQEMKDVSADLTNVRKFVLSCHKGFTDGIYGS